MTSLSTLLRRKRCACFWRICFDKNHRSSTIASRLFGLRTFYDFLHLGSQVSTIAPRYVQTRKIPKGLPHAISEEGIVQLIATARNPRDTAIIELGYASTLRVSKLADLRIEDVNLRARSLIVRRGKGGNDRIGIFGKLSGDKLPVYLGDQTTGFVFQPPPPCSTEGFGLIGNLMFGSDSGAKQTKPASA